MRWTGTQMSVSSDSEGRSYTMLTGERRERQVGGNEIGIPLRDVQGARAELILRAHDDGVAFWYRLLGEVLTSSESPFAPPAPGSVRKRAPLVYFWGSSHD